MKISKHLTILLQKNVLFNSDEDCTKSIEALKEILILSTILVYLNYEETFVLTTDASACAIGAVLSQEPIALYATHKSNIQQYNEHFSL